MQNNRLVKFTTVGFLIVLSRSLFVACGRPEAPPLVAADQSSLAREGSDVGDHSSADHNAANHRVQVFDSSGAFLDSWGTRGSGKGQFNSPFGLAIDAAGKIYVADYRNGRIQVFQ